MIDFIAITRHSKLNVIDSRWFETFFFHRVTKKIQARFFFSPTNRLFQNWNFKFNLHPNYRFFAFEIEKQSVKMFFLGRNYKKSFQSMGKRSSQSNRTNSLVASLESELKQVKFWAGPRSWGLKCCCKSPRSRLDIHNLGCPGATPAGCRRLLGRPDDSGPDRRRDVK